MVDWIKILEVIKDPDLKIQIADLVQKNIALSKNNDKLTKEIDKLSSIKETQANLFVEGNHYLLKVNENKDGPFCTKCWDSENKLIRLHKRWEDNGVIAFTCPNCNTNTQIGEEPRVIHHNRAEDIDW